jgi:hypothetical protein
MPIKDTRWKSPTAANCQAQPFDNRYLVRIGLDLLLGVQKYIFSIINLTEPINIFVVVFSVFYPVNNRANLRRYKHGN